VAASWFKRWFGREGGEERGGRPTAKLPDIPWVDAEATPWGVAVLDVRPVTHTMLSASKSPVMAKHAASFANEDGTAFIGIEPAIRRSVPATLIYSFDRYLAEGVLFLPTQMEQKWAIFYHGRKIIFVRSWRREVLATADVEVSGGTARITRIDGAFVFEDEEEPAFTLRVADFLFRTHALKSKFPAPLPAGMEAAPPAAAMWCMSAFGSEAAYATAAAPDVPPPRAPLRTDSLLHIALARGNRAAAEAQLDAGVPIDLLSRDGFSPFDWSRARPDFALAELLLARGAAVDVRSPQGATPLMNSVQERRLDWVDFLLARGADVNAADARGFTALHRAAEMGMADAVRRLLRHGARRDAEAEGHTPLSLARGRGEKEIIDSLSQE
jgi:hypothetical protein